MLRILFLFVLASSTSTVWADVVYVAPESDLQSAIDAANAGDVLEIASDGSRRSAVTVDKPLTLLPSDTTWHGTEVQLAGPGFGTVTLVGASLYAYGCSCTPCYPGPSEHRSGLTGGGFDTLLVLECDISGGSGMDMYDGGHAVFVDVPRVGVFGSSLRGGQLDNHYGCTDWGDISCGQQNGGVWHQSRNPGLGLRTTGLAIVSDSYVSTGNAGYCQAGMAGTHGCDNYYGSPAVTALVVAAADVSLSGGPGSTAIQWCGAGADCTTQTGATPCGFSLGEMGAEIFADYEMQISGGVVAPYTAPLNSTVTVDVPDDTGEGGVLVVGTGISIPFGLPGIGELMVGAPAGMVSLLQLPETGVSYQVPGAMELIGAVIAYQAWWPSTGLATPTVTVFVP